MSPRYLRKLMEEQWDKPGCASPLAPALWNVVDDDVLMPYYNPLVPDQDDGGPLPPQRAG